jgi:hypothetical protein
MAKRGTEVPGQKALFVDEQGLITSNWVLFGYFWWIAMVMEIFVFGYQLPMSGLLARHKE